MFVMMFHNTLPLAIGSSDAIINKHIAAIGTRFRYVCLYLLLLRRFQEPALIFYLGSKNSIICN